MMLFRRIHLQRPYVYDPLGLGEFYVRDHEPKNAQKDEEEPTHIRFRMSFLRSRRLPTRALETKRHVQGSLDCNLAVLSE